MWAVRAGQFHTLSCEYINSVKRKAGFFTRAIRRMTRKRGMQQGSGPLHQGGLPFQPQNNSSEARSGRYAAAADQH